MAPRSSSILTFSFLEIRCNEQILEVIGNVAHVGALDRFLVMELKTGRWTLLNELMGIMGSWEKIQENIEIVPSEILEILLPKETEKLRLGNLGLTMKMCYDIPKIFEAGEWDLFSAKRLQNSHKGSPDKWLLPGNYVPTTNAILWIIEHIDADHLPLAKRAELWSRWTLKLSVTMTDFQMETVKITDENLESISSPALKELLTTSVAVARKQPFYLKNAWSDPSSLPNVTLLHNFLGIFMRPIDLFTPTQEMLVAHPKLCKLIRKRTSGYVTSRPLHCNDIIEHWHILEPLLAKGMFSTAFSFINSYLHPLPSPAPPTLLAEVVQLSNCLN